MRPRSIVLFDWLFLGSLALGVINTAMAFEGNLALIRADPAASQAGFGTGFLLFTTAAGFAIPLLLWYFVSRRASNVAKWILIALTGIGVLAIVPALEQLAKLGTLPMVVSLLITALQIIALALLFRGDAKAWFATRGQGAPDPDVFR